MPKSTIARFVTVLAAASLFLLLPIQSTLVSAGRLATPILVFDGADPPESGLVRYHLSFANDQDFPDELFDSTSDYGPCGANTTPSRTWVDIFDSFGSRVYGFCALPNNEALDLIWYAQPEGTCAPARVYVKFTDRSNGDTVTSNAVDINPDCDSDGDDVPDVDDACQWTPAGASVTPDGCAPTEATHDLIADVGAMGLPDGLANSLVARLGQVAALLNDGNPNNDGAACEKLNAFINHVNAKEGSGDLTASQASDLRNAANDISVAIGC